MTGTPRKRRRASRKRQDPLSADAFLFPKCREAGIEGTVILQAVIGINGQILSLSPKSGPDPVLIEAAMDAVRQ